MKRITRKKLPAAVMTVFGAGMLFAAADAAAQQQAQRVEKIEVTGTNIKRVDLETVAPVEVITREQIERTGIPTVAELLRQIPAAAGGSFSESFSNSFASGASGVSLRGLGQKATLVLLNGRRVSGYGFAQNLQDTFVDINSIPASAVERIEVLKDGASAIYGSDAIAGVINIILRKDFRGIDITAQAGDFENHKNDYRVSITGGMGDLTRDRYNIVGTYEYYKRDHVSLEDTDFGSSRDYRGLAGGRNFNSLTAGGTWRQLTASGALTNNFRAMSECPASELYTAAQAVEAGLLAATSAQNIATNTFCGKHIASQLSALPQAERHNFIGRITKEFGANMTGYIDLGLSRNKNFQVFTPPFYATTALQQTSAGLRPFTYNINLAPGVAGNPFPTLAQFAGNLQILGTRDQETVSDTIRLLAGLNYAIGTWDLDSAVGWSRNKIDQDNINRITLSGTSAVFNVPTTPQPPVPTSTSTQFNLDRPSTTPQSVFDQMRADVKRESTSELKFVDTRANKDLWAMAGGQAGIALGAEYRRGELSDRPDPIAQNGQVLGQGITATDGSRNSWAVYGELALPMTKQLEGSLAVRHDHYSDYGSSTVPKVGLKFKPFGNLLLRANWGKGFRAPTLPEISPSVATFFVQVNDPVTGATGVQVSGVFAGNPDLEAEKSTSSTVGLVFEPFTNLSLGLNFYKIDWKNLVASEGFQDIVNRNDPTRVIRNPLTGTIVTVLSNYQNFDNVRTRGLDFDAKYVIPAGAWGKFTPSVNVSYVASYEVDGDEFVGRNDGLQTIPRARGRGSVDWEKGAFVGRVGVNYIRGYDQHLLAGSFFTSGDQRFQTGTYPQQVKDYTTIDLFASYQVTKNLKIFGSVLNVRNVMPPYDPGFSSTFLYDFSLYDPRGRQTRIGLTWQM